MWRCDTTLLRAERETHAENKKQKQIHMLQSIYSPVFLYHMSTSLTYMYMYVYYVYLYVHLCCCSASLAIPQRTHMFDKTECTLEKDKEPEYLRGLKTCWTSCDLQTYKICCDAFSPL